jgi:hypothetical protein
LIYSSISACWLITVYAENTDDDIPMPDGPPPGMPREEEEEDTDDDIPMPEGPPPGSTCKLYSFNAWCLLMSG